MAGANFKKSAIGGSDLVFKDLQLAASTTVVAGSMLKESGGELAIASGTNNVHYVAQEAGASSTDDIVKVAVIPAGNKLSVWEIGITPLLDDAVASSGSTTTAVATLSSGSSDDLVGGTVFVNGEQRVISANTYGGGNVTITVAEPFSRAVASGDLVRMVPYGVGFDIRLHASSGTAVLNTIAGASGGQVHVRKVDLKRKKIEVVFN